MRGIRIPFATVATLAMAMTASSVAHAQSTKEMERGMMPDHAQCMSMMRDGMSNMGSGMMDQQTGGGMMGQHKDGGMMDGDMMTSSNRGGTMGGGMMGRGMMGSGMMGAGGARPGMGGLFGSRVTPVMNLSVDDVRGYFDAQLKRLNNKRLKLGDIKSEDATITADVVTVDNSLVQRLKVDRHTGVIEYES